MRKNHEATVARVAGGARWTDAEAAAELLGLSVVTLRRTAIERDGEAAVLKEVGATGETSLRLLPGIPVRRGSVALALNDYLGRHGAAS